MIIACARCFRPSAAILDDDLLAEIARNDRP
jgi:hypothetical protein